MVLLVNALRIPEGSVNWENGKFRITGKELLTAPWLSLRLASWREGSAGFIDLTDLELALNTWDQPDDAEGWPVPGLGGPRKGGRGGRLRKAVIAAAAVLAIGGAAAAVTTSGG